MRRRNPPGEEEPWTLTFVHHSERSSTGVAGIRAGAGIPPHIHREHDELIVIVEGEASFRLGDQVREVGPGDVVSVPAGTVHAPIHAGTDCLLVAVFAPRFDPENPDRDFVD